MKNPGNQRIIPRITPHHLELTSMAKMRVRLCTQVGVISLIKACEIVFINIFFLIYRF